LDAAAAAKQANWNSILLEESADLLRNINVPLTAVTAGNEQYLPLDIDVSPFDNSGTKKEGVSRTYKGVDGYAPIFAYLGQEGYGVNVELREGSVHCQKGTDSFLEQSIHYARRITDRKLLVRMDAGDHGTSEQFHSEIKTDLDLERLPAGKFATNDLVLHTGLFAYNLLRIMGQESLREDDAPIRGNVKRRRIRTVIQNIVYMAARYVRHARNICLNFGSNSPWFRTARRLYLAFA
jgi:hypothetical protein